MFETRLRAGIRKGSFFTINVATVLSMLWLGLLLSATPVAAQTITTVVGNGVAGFSGDNGPALNAELNLPQGLVVDLVGNLYIADSFNGRVRRVDRITGRIRTVAGNGDPGFDGDGGPATAAQLGSPVALALDLAGNLYICQTGGRIRRVSALTGIITTVAGGGTQTGENIPATQAQLTGPHGVAVDTNGDLYIADSNASRVRRVDHDSGRIVTVAGTGSLGDSGDGGPAVQATLDVPASLAFDSSGNLYIGEIFGSRVRRIDRRTGVITTFAGTGSAGFSGDGGPATQAQFSALVALAFDPLGNLYIADSSNERIRRVDGQTHIVTTIAGSGPHGSGIGGFGGDGGPANQALLNAPSGLAFSVSQGLLISDQNNNRVRLVDIGLDDGFRGAPVADEFNSPILNTRWKFVDPVGDGSYSLNGSELLLAVPGGSNHDPAFGGMDNAVRVVQPIADGDFHVEVKFDSIPSLQYQCQGILVEQDAANYLRFQLGSNGASLVVSASKILSDVQTDQFSSNISVPAGTRSLWLRVRRSGETWAVTWSSDGVTYQMAGSFAHALITSNIGPFAGNYNSGVAPVFTAKVDYFRNVLMASVI
jgi:sugar lactone lactonase YvrE